MKKKLFLALILIVALVNLVLFSSCNNVTFYNYEKTEKPANEPYDIEKFFVNSEISLKDNVLTAKQGSDTKIVLELKENNKTGLEDYTYAYYSEGIIITYKNKIHIYLKEK